MSCAKASRQTPRQTGPPQRPEHGNTTPEGRGGRAKAQPAGSPRGAEAAGTLRYRSGAGEPRSPAQQVCSKFRCGSTPGEKSGRGRSVQQGACRRREWHMHRTLVTGRFFGGPCLLSQVEPEQTPHMLWLLAGLASAGFRPEPCARSPAGAFFH